MRGRALDAATIRGCVRNGSGSPTASSSPSTRGCPRATWPHPDRPAFVLVHGLASNARLWDGVAEGLVARGHPVVTSTCGATGAPRSPTAVRHAHGRRRRRRRHRSLADREPALSARSSSASPGAATSSSSWRLAARRPPGRSSAWTAAGSSRAAVFPDWEACLRALAPPRLVGRPLAEIEGYVRSTHRGLAGGRHPGHARQLRGAIRRHGGAMADLRSPRGDPPRPLGAPSLRDVPAGATSRSSSCRPTPATPSGRRGSAATWTPRWPLSRTPASAGSPVTTTSTPSTRARSRRARFAGREGLLA